MMPGASPRRSPSLTFISSACAPSQRLARPRRARQLPRVRDSSRSLTQRTYEALAPAHHRLRACDARIVDSQVAITEIAAPTGEEHARARHIARSFTDLGLQHVRTDDAGNVIGRRSGLSAGPPVVVCAHLDTVFPGDVDVRVRHQGARLEGPGIGDNGRGLAALIALAESIDGVRLRTRRAVDFVATTGEEGIGDLRGAKHFFASAQEPAAAMIALDGAGDERVVHRALGSRRYRVTFRGPGGHSWAAFGVPNAIHAAGAAVARLSAIPLQADPRTTLSVGRIGGGLSVNSIPEHAWLEIDLRSTSQVTLDQCEAEVRAVVRAAAEEENSRRGAHTPLLEVALEVIGNRPGGACSADHPLVRSALEATRLIGREPELSTASTDANVAIALGIPAVAIGAGGRGGEAHTTTEWFDNTSGTLGIARALTIVVVAAELG